MHEQQLTVVGIDPETDETIPTPISAATFDALFCAFEHIDDPFEDDSDDVDE
jgi:hypothetical protein